MNSINTAPTKLADDWSALKGQINIIIDNAKYATAMNHPKSFRIQPEQILPFFDKGQIEKARQLCAYGGWLQVEVLAPLKGINNSLIIDINLTTNAIKCYCRECGPAPYYVFTERELHWILQKALQTNCYERIPKEYKQDMVCNDQPLEVCIDTHTLLRK